MEGISVVINTVPGEVALIPRLLKSLKGLAQEIIIVSMGAEGEELTKIAEMYNATIFTHKHEDYVEAARNYGISKVMREWVLIMDPDEELSATLIKKINKVTKTSDADYYRIPRKNIIFGKWMQHSRFWPDYNIRLFKKGAVTWSTEIHAVPITQGMGKDIPAKDEYAIFHHNYQSINQYLVRMDRYTNVQATEIVNKSTVTGKPYKFIWKDLISKPLGEFLSRYFTGEGYRDGMHGLAIASLQAFSEVIVYLKIWENEKFLEQAVSAEEVASEFGKAEAEINWWLTDMIIKNKNFFAGLPHRLRRKIKNKKNG